MFDTPTDENLGFLPDEAEADDKEQLAAFCVTTTLGLSTEKDAAHTRPHRAARFLGYEIIVQQANSNTQVGAPTEDRAARAHAMDHGKWPLLKHGKPWQGPCKTLTTRKKSSSRPSAE